MKARQSTVPSRSVFTTSGGVPSSDRKSGARPGGSVPKRGRPSSRSATHQSCVAQRASRHPQSPLSNLRFPPFIWGKCPKDKGGERGMPQPRAGRPAWSRQTVYSRPSREGGYSAREARKADPRKKAYSESEPLPTKPLSRIEGGRETAHRSAVERGGCPPLFHARGLATRAATGTRTLAV